jgi:hypothetical protein
VVLYADVHPPVPLEPGHAERVDYEYIRLVQDNLNTPTSAAFYETFPSAEARRILQRIEFHYTPKHGSWLNMAEIQIAIL